MRHFESCFGIPYNAVTTLAGLWRTSVLLRYFDIFVGKVVIADFLGVFGRSSLAEHL